MKDSFLRPIIRSILILAAVAFVALVAAPIHAAPLAGGVDLDRWCDANWGVSPNTWDLDTTDANDNGANDVELGNRSAGGGARPNSPVIFALANPFWGVNFTIGSVAGGGAVTWQYRTSTGWNSFNTVIDHTGTFSTSARFVQWDLPGPSDPAWVTHDAGCGAAGSFYYARAVTTSELTGNVKGDQASAMPFNVRLKVQDELGTTFNSLATTNFLVTGGSDNTIYGFRNAGAGVYELGLNTTKADVTFSIQPQVDGYVTPTAINTASVTTSIAANDYSATPFSMKFAYKVTAITSEGPSESLTGVKVRTGTGYASATCTESGGAWYCPTPINQNAFQATKAGHVTKNGTFTTRTAHTDAQVTPTISTVRYAYRLASAADELANALTGMNVHAGTSYATGCTEYTGAWYCPAPESGSNGFQATKNGYVTANSTFAGSQRTNGNHTQRNGTATSVQFAYKVTSIAREGPGGTLAGVNVHAGTSYGTGCQESAGAWYCPVPLSGSNILQATKNGYVTKNDTFAGSTRTNGNHSQRTAAPTGVMFAYKITGVTDEKGDANTPTSVGVATGYGTSCVNSGAAWYCTVLESDAGLGIRTYRDGFVNETGTSFAGPARTNGNHTQRTASVTGVRFSLQITVDTETSLAGVTWERFVSGSWTSVTPNWTVGNSAYFFQMRSDGTVQYRATKYGVTSTTPSFQASTDFRTTYTLNLVGAIYQTIAAAASYVAGAQTTYSFTFRANHTWPANGRFQVTFPAAYTIGTPTATLTQGATGTATVGVAGQVVTVTRSNDGNAPAGGTNITVELTQITNPRVSGSSGTFALILENNGGTDLDAGSAASVTITPGALTSLATTALNYGAGNQTSYTFNFTLANPWPANGKVYIQFPAGYSIGSPAVTLVGADGTAGASVSGRNVTVLRSGDGTQTSASTAVRVSLTEITNPTTSGPTGTFAVTTRTNGNVDIDVGTAPAVTIQPGPVATITVTPGSANVTANTTQDFNHSAVDAYGNAKTITPTWSMTPASCGNITAAGLLTAPLNAPRSCTVHAQDGGVDGTATANIVQDAIQHIHITNPIATLTVNQTHGYTVVGHDQYHNTVANAASWGRSPASCGNFTGATFQAPTNAPRTCTITATDGAMSDSDSVDIVQDSLEHIHVVPAALSLAANTTYGYAATGHDVFHNSVSITPVWTRAPASCGNFTGATFQAPRNAPRSCTVTATDGAVSGNGNVDIVPAPGDHIHVSPASATIAVLETQQFTATQHDVEHNLVAGALSWSRSPDGCGSIDGTGFYTAPNATGTCTVTVANASVTQDATVTVTPEPVGHFHVTVDDATLDAGEQTNATATGHDQYHNVVTPTNHTWSASCGTIDQNGTYTATAAGSCVVTAAEGNATGNATITVAATPMTNPSLKATVVPGASSTYAFTFKNTAAWPKDGKFEAVFPAGYTFAGPVATIKTTPGTAGGATVSVSGQTVTVTRNGLGTNTPTNALITVSLTKIVNPSTRGYTGSFGITMEDSTGADINFATLPGINIGPIVAPTFKPKSPIAGQSSNHTIAFKPPVMWPADGKLEVVLPAGYWADTPTAYLKSGTLPMGTASVSVSGTTITVTRDGNGIPVPAGTAVTLTIDPIRSPQVSGTVGEIRLIMRDAANGHLATGIPASPKLVPGPLTFMSASATDRMALNETSYTFRFKTFNPLPVDGKIYFLFPGKWQDHMPFEFSNMTANVTVQDGGSNVTMNGTFTLTNGLFTVDITRNGDGGVIAPTNFTVTLTGIRNPQKAAGQVVIETRTAANIKLDAGKAPAVPILVNPLAAATLLSPTHATGVWKKVDDVTMKWTKPTSLTVVGYSWSLNSDPDNVTDGNQTILQTILSDVADGNHTFKLRAVNSLGTWGPVVKYTRIFVDDTSPSGVTITSWTHPPGVCGGVKGTFNWTAATDATSGMHLSTPYAFSIDGGAATKTTKLTITKAGLTPGNHTAKIVTMDKANNIENSTYAFQVCGLYSDSHPMNVWQNENDVSVYWLHAANPLIDGYSWAADAEPDTVIDGTTPSTTFMDLADGVHAIKMRAHYSDSNTWSAAVSHPSVKIDTVAPVAPTVTSLTHPGPGCAAATTATISWVGAVDLPTGRSGLASPAYKWTLDGGPETAIKASPLKLTGLASGAHTVQIYVLDKAGNQAAAAPFNFSVC